MYKKNLFVVPSAGGKASIIIPEILLKEKEKGKKVCWLTNKDEIEYCGLVKEGIQTLLINQYEDMAFEKGNIYQIICPSAWNTSDWIEKVVKFFASYKNDVSFSMVINAANHIAGSNIVELLYQKNAADIYLIYDMMHQAYDCISNYTIGNATQKDEYQVKKFLDKCRKEFHTYESNRIFWMDNRGVVKVKQKHKHSEGSAEARPLPTYQPYEIFGCQLFHYKQGCLPGMTTEEMVQYIRTQI